jgi:hypothetical protein
VVVALYNASIMLWTTLKQHGQSQWVRSSYFWLFFVPVVAHSMSSLNEGTTLDLGDWHLELSMKLPFSWKLFYFGAVCFSLAGIVYYFFARAWCGITTGFRNSSIRVKAQRTWLKNSLFPGRLTHWRIPAAVVTNSWQTGSILCARLRLAKK